MKTKLTESISNNSEIVKCYRKTKMRYVALAMACLVMIGSYMCYDFPSYLKSQVNKSLNLTEFQYSLLYAVYSFPNIALPLFGGIFIDIVGVRKGIFIFTFILIIGQLLCSIGVLHSVNNFSVILVGRVIFGLGGESLSVTQSAIVSQWFKGKEISLALGLNISIARLGSVIGSFLFPALYNINKDLFSPLLVGAIFCVFSWLCGCVLNFLDKKADQQEGKQQVKISDQDRIKLSDFKELNIQFWLLCISCVFTYMCFFPFMQFVQGQISDQFGLSSDKASNLMSLPYLIAAGCTPFAGLLVDKVGKRGLLLIITSVLMITSHLTMLIMPQCGNGDPNCQQYTFLFPLVLFGIFYSFYAAVLWPCIPLVVPEKIVGTAFGITNSLQNGGLALGPIIVGLIIDHTKHKMNEYFWMEIFFIIFGGLCLIINITIYWIDIKGNKVLDLAFKETTEDDEQIEEYKKNSQAVNPRRSLAAKRSFRG
ncbi:major facilitator superfamily domain protein [Ichthyophthirius multifiliis]|uniref:Lysosomal dipeptide transporter MFSD1 n=1 Tax=Ichthyophthirius multifiliis TaxID=5932 RepID=G0QK40_ICHMU|nr:major facilitator superfamily domain protein [Ichthyophthirius multifiliis]EGR34415.1 major facilitator superfamily domain protein [Ichthyophthirius multifiliis]|eukprot:XP_004039719.1 major facilitator superfamily domain protein [Ichthyophthirius multifiliis]